MNEKDFEYILLQNPSGTITEEILINGHIYEISYEWQQRIHIKIKPLHHLFQSTAVSEIRKMPLISLIARYPNFSLKGKRTQLTEKLLSNKYTPALLQYRASRLICQNNQICYTATIKKKDIAQLAKILQYFEALLITSK